MLWRMPPMAKPSSARDCAATAASRVGGMGDELGDHRVVEDRDRSPPSTTPVSTRTVTPVGGAGLAGGR